VSNTLKLLESTFSYIPTDKGLNFIVCSEFKETFLNVYELVIAGKHIIAECVDTIDNSPIIKLNIEYNNSAYDALFVIKEGDDNIIFNPATLRHGSKILQTEKSLLEDIAADDIIIAEDTVVEEVIKPDAKLDIERYKKDALKIIGENYIDKKSKIEDLKASLVFLIEKNLSDIKSSSVTDINTIKTQLHESVIEQVNNYKIDTDASITEINSIRENVLSTVDLYVDNIKQVVSEKTEDLTSLQESVIYSINEKIAELDIVTENHRKEVEAAFTGLSQLANNSSIQLTGMVGEIYEDVAKVKQSTIDELNAELTSVTASVNSKLKDLQSTADKKISSISKLVESKISELQTEKDKTHVELVAAKNELVNSLQEAIKTFKIETTDKTAGLLEIKHQFLEQVKEQSDTISAAVIENKQEIQTLTTKITEAVEEKIKKINLVATKKEDLAQLKKQLEQRIDAESANIKKVLSSYGGGGSVAAQYAKGGTMNGSLNVNGQILSGGIDISTFFGGGDGAYLPLSGGSLSGPMSVSDESTRRATLSQSALNFADITGNTSYQSSNISYNSASFYNNDDESTQSTSSILNFNGLNISSSYQGSIIAGVTLGGSELTFNSNTPQATITGLDRVTSNTFVGRLSGTASNNLPLSGGTLTGVLSTTNVIYASGGNSNQWNSTYSTVQTNSGSWNPAGSYLSLSGGTLSGAVTIGNAENLATTPTNLLTLRNTTVATSGTPVQVSPALLLEGQGWKTTATAASQSVRFRQSVLPIQGTTAPAGLLLFQSDINNTNTWTNRLAVGFGSTVNGLYTETGGGIYFAGISAGNQNNVGISGSGLAGLNMHCNGSITHSLINNASQGYIQALNTGGFAWSSTSTAAGTADLILLRSAAATLQLGVNNATTATNQTIKAHNVTTGTGANLTLAGGTGSVANGAVIVTTALLGTSSGSTQPAFGAAINTDFGIYFESSRMMIREGPNTIGAFGDNASGIGLIMASGRAIGWSSTTPDGVYSLQMNRAAAATPTLMMGAGLASGWINQTIAAAGGRIATDVNNSPTNTLTIAGSISTGTGTGGDLILGVYGTNGTSGSAIGTLNTVLTVVAARKVINLAGIPTSAAGLSTGDIYSNAGVLTIVP